MTTTYAPSQYRIRTTLVRERSLPPHLIEGPKDMATFIEEATHLSDEPQEIMGVVFVDARHKVIGFEVIARGQLNACAIEPRDVFRSAIIANAKGIILFHNHPTGDPEPSEDDIRITRRLVSCGKTLAVEVLDHLVIGDRRWVSLRERGAIV